MFSLSSWENMGSLGSGSEGCSCWQLRRSPWASRHSMSGPTRPTLFVFFSYEKSVRRLKRSQKPEKSEEWSQWSLGESWVFFGPSSRSLSCCSMARPRTLLWAHAFSGHSEVPRSKCCSDNMAKGPENSVFLGVDFLGKPYTSTNRGVGWAGGSRWVSKMNQIIGLSALNIDMGVVPEASRSLNWAERGIMKYSYISYIHTHTHIYIYILYIYIYARLSHCVHTLKRVNCFAMFDIIQWHSV